MEYYFCEDPDLCTLTEEESRHCIQVRREKKGSRIGLLDGKGGSYVVEIVEAAAKKVRFVIQEAKHTALPAPIKLAVAPIKSTDRLEWMVEKCTEIGITDLIFISTRRTERKSLNLDRLHKVAISALKQSGNLFLPQFRHIASLEDYLNTEKADHKWVAQLSASPSIQPAPQLQSEAVVMIGPEGDFSPDELDDILRAGFKPLSLGRNRLRTETAALVAAVWLRRFS